MTRHKITATLLTGGCLAIFAGMFAQRSQLSDLRAEAQQLGASSADAGASPVSLESVPLIQPAPVASSVSLEILRLRSQVSRLRADLRDLSAVSGERDRLLVAIAAASTNAPTQALPAGYVRKAAAQFVGQATPTDTIQTFLWAMQHRDLTNLLQTLTPESVQRLQLEFQHSSPEQFFKSADALPGLGIVGSRDVGDGTLVLKLQVITDLPPMEVKFQQLGGNWRMEMPH